MKKIIILMALLVLMTTAVMADGTIMIGNPTGFGSNSVWSGEFGFFNVAEFQGQSFRYIEPISVTGVSVYFYSHHVGTSGGDENLEDMLISLRTSGIEGPVVAQVTVEEGEVPFGDGGMDWYQFDFDTPYTIDAATDYFITLEIDRMPNGVDLFDQPYEIYQSNDGYPDGTRFFYAFEDGMVTQPWGPASNDLAMQIHWVTACEPDWECDGWGQCIQFKQECTSVTDNNACGSGYMGDYSEFGEQSCGTTSSRSGSQLNIDPRNYEQETLSVAPVESKPFNIFTLFDNLISSIRRLFGLEE